MPFKHKYQHTKHNNGNSKIHLNNTTLKITGHNFFYIYCKTKARKIMINTVLKKSKKQLQYLFRQTHKYFSWLKVSIEYCTG